VWEFFFNTWTMEMELADGEGIYILTPKQPSHTLLDLRILNNDQFFIHYHK